MYGMRDSQPEELPDFFLRGMPMTLTTAVAYFQLKNYAQWVQTIALAPGETWDTLADRLEHRFACHIWHPKHWESLPIPEDPMPVTERTELLTLCADLQQVGIWLTFNEAQALIVGPPQVVHKHPALLARIREHKAAIVHLLEDSLAHGLFGTQAADPRFEREVCPECQQQCLVILGPRRLGVHRLPDTKTVCPGSDRAQQTTTETLMLAFLADRCLARAGATLSWYALRGALEGWCAERALLLPPRPFVFAWLDRHWTRHGDEDQPCWDGFTLTLREWGLDDEPPPAQPELRAPRKPRKAVFKA